MRGNTTEKRKEEAQRVQPEPLTLPLALHYLQNNVRILEKNMIYVSRMPNSLLCPKLLSQKELFG